MVCKTLTTCTNDGSRVSSSKVTFSYVQLFVTDFNHSAAVCYAAAAAAVNHSVVGAVFVHAGITYPSPYTPIYSKRNDDMFVNTTMTVSVNLNKNYMNYCYGKKQVYLHSSRIIIIYNVMSYRHLVCV